MKQFDTTVMEHAFQTQSSWDASTSARQRPMETNREEQGYAVSKNKGNGKPFSPIKCFYCDKLGHTIKFCRKRLAEENKTSNFMHKEDSHNDDTMFMMLSIQEPNLRNLWYLESGCSNHMIGNRELFLNLEESEKKDVKIGDDKKLSVHGSGDIAIKINDKDKKISNVFFVPGLKHNLLGVGQVIQKGYGLQFKDRLCEITDSNNFVIRRVAMTTNMMFPIKFNDDTFFSLSVSTKEICLLWHKRFGHVNLNTLSHMHKNDFVKGLPFVAPLSQICEGCALGKQSRESFPDDKA
ncbi:uncharacterized protein LOC112502978 [Cynara cardunculus var. scolymus]|uniref:uncharacterized protein LOC112502978 n=1 Tax=Cynara cardunculus var. scolymus TaxID=59895 RepID=UPI000D631004|nr:uncharacterized protein LOC112502978 [Cynara cardunculus var. scolymus]